MIYTNRKALLQTSIIPVLAISLTACTAEQVQDAETTANELVETVTDTVDSAASNTGTFTIISSADVEPQPLNPARGDASPQATVLWGDITKDMPSGMILEFADGFTSPPHIHNITYRAVVISGGAHNDDPGAAMTWMGPGSFWTQPAGEDHITAAKPGNNASSFLEILSGPYLVQPSDEAFDNGEQALNLSYDNMVWLGAADSAHIAEDSDAELVHLWGDLSEGSLSASMTRLPSGAEITLSSDSDDLKLVIIRGAVTHSIDGQSEPQSLATGSYVSSEGQISHNFTCDNAQDCLIYIRTADGFSID